MADEKIGHGFIATEIEGAHFLKGEMVVVVGGFVVVEKETTS